MSSSNRIRWNCLSKFTATLLLVVGTVLPSATPLSISGQCPYPQTGSLVYSDIAVVYDLSNTASGVSNTDVSNFIQKSLFNNPNYQYQENNLQLIATPPVPFPQTLLLSSVIPPNFWSVNSEFSYDSYVSTQVLVAPALITSNISSIVEGLQYVSTLPGRSYVPTTIIIVTKSAAEAASAQETASSLKNEGKNIVTVLFGTTEGQTVLANMSSPGLAFTLPDITNTSAVTEVVQNIAQSLIQICSWSPGFTPAPTSPASSTVVTTVPTTLSTTSVVSTTTETLASAATTPTPVTCGYSQNGDLIYLDIAVVYDLSISTSGASNNDVVNFIQNSLFNNSYYQYQENNGGVQLITTSPVPFPQTSSFDGVLPINLWNCNSQSEYDSFVDTELLLASFLVTSSNSSINDGLQYVSTLSGRPNVQTAIIVVTKSAADAAAAQTTASGLKNQGKFIVTVLFGTEDGESELANLASQNLSFVLPDVSNTSAVTQVVQSIAQGLVGICSVSASSFTTTTPLPTTTTTTPLTTVASTTTASTPAPTTPLPISGQCPYNQRGSLVFSDIAVVYDLSNTASGISNTDVSNFIQNSLFNNPNYQYQDSGVQLITTPPVPFPETNLLSSAIPSSFYLVDSQSVYDSDISTQGLLAQALITTSNSSINDGLEYVSTLPGRSYVPTTIIIVTKSAAHVAEALGTATSMKNDGKNIVTVLLGTTEGQTTLAELSSNGLAFTVSNVSDTSAVTGVVQSIAQSLVQICSWSPGFTPAPTTPLASTTTVISTVSTITTSTSSTTSISNSSIASTATSAGTSSGASTASTSAFTETPTTTLATTSGSTVSSSATTPTAACPGGNLVYQDVALAFQINAPSFSSGITAATNITSNFIKSTLFANSAYQIGPFHLSLVPFPKTPNYASANVIQPYNTMTSLVGDSGLTSLSYYVDNAVQFARIAFNSNASTISESLNYILNDNLGPRGGVVANTIIIFAFDDSDVVNSIDAANQLKAQGKEIMAMGYGSSVSQLQQLVSRSNYFLTFDPSTGQELADSVAQLLLQRCSTTGT